MKNERYNSSFLVPDFVDIQRKSFFHLLKSGILEEFSKVNPIVSDISKLKLTFYPENFLLILPDLTVSEAILEGKTYSCKLYVPAAIDVYKTKGSRRGFDDQGLKGQPVVSSLKKQRSSYVAPSLAGDSNVTPSTARGSLATPFPFFSKTEEREGCEVEKIVVGITDVAISSSSVIFC